MSDALRLVVVSTSRADLGAQAPVVRAALRDVRFDATLVVTGHHLADGTPRADECVDLPLVRLPAADTSLGGVHQRALAELLRDRRAEVVLINGDRWELLDVAAACCVAGVVLAHAAGGERTIGALDDLVRDALTKLAHLHYPVHAPAAMRLRALQEDEQRICVAGEPALDELVHAPRATIAELTAAVGRLPTAGDIVVALHPVTRRADETAAAIAAIRGIADAFPDRALFLSSTNADPGHEAIVAAWRQLRARATVLGSLGNRLFRTLVATCGVLVGNSSAGLYEAPSLGARSVDLGTRQLGRIAAASVRRVDPITADAAVSAVRWAIAGDRRPVANPYGDGASSARILEHLWQHARRPGLLIKDAGERAVEQRR